MFGRLIRSRLKLQEPGLPHDTPLAVKPCVVATLADARGAAPYLSHKDSVSHGRAKIAEIQDLREIAFG